MGHDEAGTYGILSPGPATTFAELRRRLQDVWDHLSQDDIRYLYDCMQEYTPALPPEGPTLCIDETAWTPLPVMCFIWSEFIIIYSYSTMINYLSHQFSMQWTCPWRSSIFSSSVLYVRRRGGAVESLPSNTTARVRFPAGSEILISILGVCVCFVCVLSSSPNIVLTTHSERPVLVYLSSVLVQRLLLPPTGIWPTNIWLVSPWGCKSYIGEGR